MAGSKTDYLETAILNHVLRNTALTSPTTVYAALYTVTPSDSAAGTEVTGNNYARTAITFGAPSGGVTSNSAAVTFPTPSGSWGTVVAWAVCDASTGGNILYWSDQTPSKAIAANDTVQFAIGALVISED